jgi:hypothetical protein
MIMMKPKKHPTGDERDRKAEPSPDLDGLPDDMDEDDRVARSADRGKSADPEEEASSIQRPPADS